MELIFISEEHLLEYLLLERGEYALSPEQYWIARESESDEDDPNSFDDNHGESK